MSLDAFVAAWSARSGRDALLLPRDETTTTPVGRLARRLRRKLDHAQRNRRAPHGGITARAVPPKANAYTVLLARLPSPLRQLHTNVTSP